MATLKVGWVQTTASPCSSTQQHHHAEASVAALLQTKRDETEKIDIYVPPSHSDLVGALPVIQSRYPFSASSSCTFCSRKYCRNHQLVRRLGDSERLPAPGRPLRRASAHLWSDWRIDTSPSSRIALRRGRQRHAMGTNGGSGIGGAHEAGGIMGSSANQPPTTEYTLQGRCSNQGWR